LIEAILLILVLVLSVTALFLTYRSFKILLHIVFTVRGSVFEPSSQDKIKTIIELAQPKKSDKIIDLGAGDGELMLAFAQRGFEIEGVELNPLLLQQAKKRFQQPKIANLVQINQGNFLEKDLSQYDLLLVYCPQHVMEQLEPKLKKELKPGARVVSNYFHFSSWEPEQVKNEVRLYRKN
jgi:16S rRNA A1518/A1519 N6-dimethyltransferase RsmA/KsgA/DIM1 with predicted DNA glycosylase/AP lyase activity